MRAVSNPYNPNLKVTVPLTPFCSFGFGFRFAVSPSVVVPWSHRFEAKPEAATSNTANIYVAPTCAHFTPLSTHRPTNSLSPQWHQNANA